MWPSLSEYAHRLWHYWHIMLTAIIFAGIGGAYDFAESTGLVFFTVSHLWGRALWIIALVGFFIIAPFLAFHKVRSERDALNTALDKVSEPQAEERASRSLFAIQFLENGGLPVFFENDGHGRSGRLGIPGKDGWHDLTEGNVLELYIAAGTTAIPDAQLESIELLVAGRKIPTDWESRKVEHTDAWEFHIEVPDWVTPGVHSIRLVGVFDGVERKTPPKELMFPRR